MKTISVYDAVKLATKGPLDSVSDERGVYVARVIEGHNLKPCVAPMNCLDKKEATANATLLAHFFNHGPALLAMLEEFVKLQEPFRKQLDANETEILDESIALIAKASKVEIEE